MVSPVEEDARFPKARLRSLEARKYDWVMYRRIVRVKLFNPIRLLAKCPTRDITGQKRRGYIRFWMRRQVAQGTW